MPGTKGTAKPKGAAAASKKTYGLGLSSHSFELELPSGNTCLAIRPGAQGLIKAGLLDSMDQLTAMVQTEHIDSKDPRKMAQAVQALAVDTEKLLEGLEVVDRCVAHVVQEPKVWLDEPEVDKKTGKPVFETVEDSKGRSVERPVYKPRQSGRIYADQVDLEDKMFIFQWAVGGTADLKSFREQSEQLLGSVSAS